MRVSGSIGPIIVLVLGTAVPAVLLSSAVGAERYTSSNYTIDASVGNTFGGSTGSTNYKMVTSGGEAVVGNGASGSYRLGSGYIAGLERSIQLNVQPANLQLQYPMDELSGTRLLDNASGTTAARLVNGPTREAGKIGQAVNFNGSNHYATAGGQRDLDVDPGEARTFSAWFKAGAQSQQTYLLWQTANCKGWSLSLLTTGDVRLDFSASANGCTSPSPSNAATAGTRYDDSVWHHVAGVIDRPGGTMKLYIDGQLKKTTTGVNNADPAADGDFVVAAKGDFTGNYNGLIDEVKAFDYAMSDKAVAHEYTAQNAGIPSSYTFPNIVPNQSQQVAARAIVQTDAPGYTIAISQDQNLTSGAYSISPVTGTIAEPALWSEGTTKGLGFTLTSGTGLDAKWGTSPNYKYAAIPGSSTSIHARSGYTGGIKDIISSQYRLDVTASQTAGDYKNRVTYSATILP